MVADRLKGEIRGKLLAIALGAVALATPSSTAIAQQSAATFTNPLLPSGPDPWVLKSGRHYYYMSTARDRIVLWRTDNIADLREAEQKTVWTPPATGPNAHNIWAPELHRIDGKWFLYYSATASGFNDDTHRAVFVLENDGDDPFIGDWIDRGRLKTKYAGIDGTTFSDRGRRFFVYSAYVGPVSALAIAPMANPWTLGKGERIIARPTRPWESADGRSILEGPEFLRGPKGDLFLTYSAGPCWSDGYALGLLHAAPGADPLDPAAWSKAPQSVFHSGNGVYATGHNGFFTSPDGRENWIIYHANSGPGMKCTPKRAPHIQRFGWTKAGWPDFGAPVAEATPQGLPSGTVITPVQ